VDTSKTADEESARDSKPEETPTGEGEASPPAGEASSSAPTGEKSLATSGDKGEDSASEQSPRVDDENGSSVVSASQGVVLASCPV